MQRESHGTGSLSIGTAGCRGRGSADGADGDDGGAQIGMRCEDAVIAVAVHARRRHEGDEALEELQRREDDVGAPVRGGFGEPIENLRVGRREGGDAGESMESFEREGRTGTVAEETLEAGAVVPLDAHGSSASGRPPFSSPTRS